MTKIGKKLAAVFLAVAMVVTFVPVLGTQTAYADVIPAELDPDSIAVQILDSTDTVAYPGDTVRITMTITNHSEDYPPMMSLIKPQSGDRIVVRPHRVTDTNTWLVDIPIAEDDECGTWRINSFILFSSDNSQVRYIRLGGDGDPEDHFVDLSRGNYEVYGTALDVKDISAAVVAEIPAKVYDGTPYNVEPIVTFEDKTLANGTDYYLAYPECEGNTAPSEAGEYKVVITGFGKYTGSIDMPFTITPKKITPKVSLSATSYTWNNKVRKPSVTVKGGSVKLNASDYTVSYATGRKNVGKYSVKVTLKGNYSGTKTVTFKINPKGTSLKTLTKASKAATVKWTKQSAKMSSSRITGYQIQLATDSKFTKNRKTVTMKGYSKTSKKVTGLKGGKKYWVKIRTYKTVKGTKYYSPWSKVKTVTTKK